MEKKEFSYELSDIDMRDFYTEILYRHESIPAFIILEETEDGSEILRGRMTNGNEIIYLKNSENMFNILDEELETKKAGVVDAPSFQDYDWSEKEVGNWMLCTCKIADLLNIRCPQIIFTPFEDGGNAGGKGAIFLPNKDQNADEMVNIGETFLSIAHELRHIWQHKHHPEWFKGYVHVESDEDMEAYLNHRTEIDAEAYARKLAEMVLGVSLFSDGKKITKKLKNRAKEIDILLSGDDIAYFNVLFNAEEWE